MSIYHARLESMKKGVDKFHQLLHKAIGVPPAPKAVKTPELKNPGDRT